MAVIRSLNIQGGGIMSESENNKHPGWFLHAGWLITIEDELRKAKRPRTKKIVRDTIYGEAIMLLNFATGMSDIPERDQPGIADLAESVALLLRGKKYASEVKEQILATN